VCCGNGACTAPENCTTCIEDCGECACVPMPLSELISIINEWKLGAKSLNEVMGAIVEWKSGC